MPWMPSIAALAAGPPQPVRIVGFGQTAQIFSSKQRPIKLTIYGDDFKCAPLLHMLTVLCTAKPRLQSRFISYCTAEENPASAHEAL